MKHLLFFLLFLFSLNSCEYFADRVYSFWIYNNSEFDLNFILSYSYPDTIIPNLQEQIGSLISYDSVPVDSKEKWEIVFDELPVDTLSIFIFSRDTLIKYGWDKLRLKYNILDRIDLSLEDLQTKNWTIIYPEQEHIKSSLIE